MKIAVSATGPTLDAMVDPRLGRCEYFIIVDPETMEFEGIQNSSTALMHGAGIQTAQMIANKGAKVVLTGNCGPNAFQTLSAAGIQVITGVSGKVREAVERYKRGELKPTNQANVSSHFGSGMGAGRGMGMGRGMGRGMMGGGFQGMNYGPAMPGASSEMTREEELKFLKNQAQLISQQLEQINKRIRELEQEEK